jgi:hypothetical protein
MMRVKYSFVKNVLQSIYICCFIKKKISKLLVASMVGFKSAYMSPISITRWLIAFTTRWKCDYRSLKLSVAIAHWSCPITQWYNSFRLMRCDKDNRAVHSGSSPIKRFDLNTVKTSVTNRIQSSHMTLPHPSPFPVNLCIWIRNMA